jgi:hypothetical protein
VGQADAAAAVEAAAAVDAEAAVEVEGRAAKAAAAVDAEAEGRAAAEVLFRLDAGEEIGLKKSHNINQKT